MKQVKLIYSQFNRRGHYYGMIAFDSKQIEIIRKVTVYDLDFPTFKGYDTSCKTMRFWTKDALFAMVDRYCNKIFGFGKYKLTIERD